MILILSEIIPSVDYLGIAHGSSCKGGKTLKRCFTLLLVALLLVTSLTACGRNNGNEWNYFRYADFKP